MVPTKKGKARTEGRRSARKLVAEVNQQLLIVGGRDYPNWFAGMTERRIESLSVLNAGKAKVDLIAFRKVRSAYQPEPAPPAAKVLRRRNLLRRFSHRRRGEFVTRFNRSSQDIFDAWELLDETVTLLQRLAAKDRSERYK